MAKLKAEPSEIRRFMGEITHGWDEIDGNPMIEIRALAENSAPNTARFSLDWIDDAAEHAQTMNDAGRNVYMCINPVNGRADIKAGKGAHDEDILAAFYCFADADTDGAMKNILSFAGPQFTMSVKTGTVPFVRGHCYWRLDEPVRNMQAWRDTQQSIAHSLKTDEVVINPSRIMRVAGTVSWPSEKKKAKGYTPELVTMRTEFSTDRDPVPFERMMRAFPRVEKAAATAATDGTFNIDLGQQAMDRAMAQQAVMEGNDWHHNVVRLVASYVAKGLADAEIHAITDNFTQPPYTVDDTRREVQQAIDGAREKGWTPEQKFTPNFDYSPAPAVDPISGTPAPLPQDRQQPWQLQRADSFTQGFVAPEYIIDGVIQRGRLYTLTAPTGSGKTAVMLYAAIAVATGTDFCGIEVEQGDVLFLAGENPDDVRARVIATLEFYNIDASRCRLHFVAGTFGIRSDMERLKEEAEKLPNLIMVVIDTFAAYFDGEDENSNAQALSFARVTRQITAFKSKPAVVMPAHPVKGATKSNLAPKGGSSLVNEVDGNLTLWNDSGILTLHWQVKFRGAEFEPIKFELESKSYDKLKDAKGRIMPTILAKPLLETRKLQIVSETISYEDQILLSIRDYPEKSVAQRCVDVGLMSAKGEAQKSKLQRIIGRLQEQKLIRKFRSNWELTKHGDRAVDMIENGTPMASDEL